MYDFKDIKQVENKEPESHCELNERSFYPPEDTRFYVSGVDDIDGGDNFYDYAEYFWDTYGHELYDEI